MGGSLDRLSGLAEGELVTLGQVEQSGRRLACQEHGEDGRMVGGCGLVEPHPGPVAGRLDGDRDGPWAQMVRADVCPT